MAGKAALWAGWRKEQAKQSLELAPADLGMRRVMVITSVCSLMWVDHQVPDHKQ